MLLAEVGIGTDADATRIDISEYGISVRYWSIQYRTGPPYRYGGTGLVLASGLFLILYRTDRIPAFQKTVRRKKGIHTCTCLHC